MPSGSGGQIAISRTDSLYLSLVGSEGFAQGAVGWHWTNFVSESVEHNLDRLEEGAITGYKDAPPNHKGIDSGQGDIQLEPNPNALGHFLRAAFGQASGSLLTHAGSWGANSGNALNLPPGYGSNARPVMRHRFTPVQSAFDERTFLPPYSLMLYKDQGSAFFFNGVVVPSIEFNIQAGQLARTTVSIMARDVGRASRTSSMAALRNPGGRPWVWDMASVQVSSSDGTLGANTNFEALTIRIESPQEGVVLLDGTKKFAEFQMNGFRRVNLSGTLSFRNQQEYDAFVAYENRAMRLNLRNVNSALILGNPDSAHYFELQIDIPQFKFLTWSTPVGGPNRLQTQFTGAGEFDTTSLYMIEAQLINTQSMY